MNELFRVILIFDVFEINVSKQRLHNAKDGDTPANR